MATMSYLRGEVPVVQVHSVNEAEKERTKYEGVWGDIDNYGVNSPGLNGLDHFLDVLKPPAQSSILDIGCGTGAAGLALLEKGYQVNFLDITSAGLDPQVNRKYFTEAPLWKPLANGSRFDYGYCADVMEHIAVEWSMLSVANLLRACTVVWFQISLQADEFGKAIGTSLHVNVQEFTWWRDHLAALGKLIDARDLGGRATYVVSR